MLYTVEVTVPASTTETSPSVTVLGMTHGIITRVSFRPRPGHSSLLHCRVFYHEHQLFPTNAEEDLHGDTFPIEWDEHEEVFIEPFELKIVSWNDDDTYSHTFDISFALLPRESVLPDAIARVISGLYQLFVPRRTA